MASIEKKVDDLVQTFHRTILSYRSPSRSPSRYSAGPQGDYKCSRQWSPAGYWDGSLYCQSYVRYWSPSRQPGGYRRGDSPNRSPGRGLIIEDLLTRLSIINRLCLGTKHTPQIIGGIMQIPDIKIGSSHHHGLLDHHRNKCSLGPTIKAVHTPHLGPTCKALLIHKLHQQAPKPCSS